MRLSRRSVLLGGTALSMGLFPHIGGAQDVWAKSLFLVLTDVDPSLDPERVERMLKVFFARNLPLAIVLEVPTDGDGAQSGTDERLEALARIAVSERGLFEVIPAVSPVQERDRYFQLRFASEIRRRLALPADAEMDEPQIVSFFDTSATNEVEPYAYRSAGFRIHIRPAAVDGAAGTRVDPFDWGLLRLEGGVSFRVTEDPEEAVGEVLALDGDQLLMLSLDGAGALDPEVLAARCDAWAERIEIEALNGTLFVTRPTDYLLQAKPGASKYLGVVLDLGQGPEPDAGVAAFAAMLAEEGFPFTALALQDTAPDVGASDLCLSGEVDLSADDRVLPRCSNVDDPSGIDPDRTAEILLLPPETPQAWTGLREDGRFQIALRNDGGLSLAERIAADPLTDRVEMVRPAQVQTPFERLNLMKQFTDIRRDGLAEFHSVRGFMERIVAPDPILERFWSTRRRQLTDPPRAAQIDLAERQRLLEDARLAWRYIARFTDDNTGLCAGTVQATTFALQNREVTLWDVASQILGIVSAAGLGIITDVEGAARLATILENLPSVQIGEGSFPPPLFRADTLRAVRTGFDSCDTGRFLVALRVAVMSGLVSIDRAEAALAEWDLDQTVRGGRPYSHQFGRWVDASLSHCPPYVHRAYTSWGLPMNSAYPPLAETDTGDARLRLLHRAALLGHFGAEPILLEAIELGHSPQSRYLADVLFDAQLSWFEETGEIRSVSEVPLNFEPWFIYQGLRVDLPGEDAWAIVTRLSRAEYRTEEFRKRAEQISTKSAYLWAAAYPHEYSDRLVALVRDKARIDNAGFCSGIFASTLEPMQGYTDLNTNGIILTAIGRMLGAMPALWGEG
ncbi:DUF3131 domain-containing protein [Ostreiculturibacter nitratireducens]|uniref:DUF3131 domain-containing protein n=1 Tax=Ostreiculturibacter nitratireducens TaxID=3075226 RepID=UPI0031B5BF69